MTSRLLRVGFVGYLDEISTSIFTFLYDEKISLMDNFSLLSAKKFCHSRTELFQAVSEDRPSTPLNIFLLEKLNTKYDQARISINQYTVPRKVCKVFHQSKLMAQLLFHSLLFLLHEIRQAFDVLIDSVGQLSNEHTVPAEYSTNKADKVRSYTVFTSGWIEDLIHYGLLCMAFN